MMTDRTILLLVSFLAALCGFWLYYRIFRGTGLRFGVVVALLLGGLSYVLPSVGKNLAFILFGTGIVIELLGVFQKRDFAHSRFIYEGGGIRRGFLPVEAGVIFGLTNQQLFILALLDLLQKRFVTQQSTPGGGISVQVFDGFAASKGILSPSLRREQRKEIAFENMRELSGAEDFLLEMFIQTPHQSLDKFALDPWGDYMKRQVNMKLRGFDFEVTKTYYRDFINHRVKGVNAGNFNATEYYGWMILGIYLDEVTSDLATELLKSSHPEWMRKGESLWYWFENLRLTFG